MGLISILYHTYITPYLICIGLKLSVGYTYFKNYSVKSDYFCFNCMCTIGLTPLFVHSESL